MAVPLFVYGTLKPGHWAFDQFCQGQVLALTPALVRGRLYHLCLGYPRPKPGTRLGRGGVADPGQVGELDGDR
jgi:gamma-glutamylcyclotransferase (GGCT)/AIG2-like uncharacterized protein YtfP